MPRPMIPSECKRMRTLYANLTITTEEEIWNHLKSKIDNFIKEVDEFKTKQNELINYIFDTNPYKNFSWRKGRTPNRIKFDEWRKGIREEEFETTILHHFDFKHDWKLCVRAFKWNDEENPKFEEVSSIEHEIFNKYAYDIDTNEEFDIYEKIHYKKSKEEWEINDIEWITENKLKEQHKSHSEKVPDLCKYCVQDIEEEKARQIRQAKDEEQSRIWNEEWQTKRRQELENRELLSCDCCSFSTFNDETYDKHLDSKEHKKLDLASKLFCKDCSVQCRNQIEFNVHIHTKKHKIAIGEVDKVQEYKCELCNYATHLKQNFDKHCLTKAHMDKHK